MHSVSYLPGILLAAIPGLAAYYAAPYLPASLGSIIVALLLGMLIGNVFRVPEKFHTGIVFTSGKLLEFSILFLAFSISYRHIAELGGRSFSIIVVVVAVMVLVSYFLAIRVRCPGSTGWLVGFGTAICGSSAIAALAPGISKNKDDVAISMAVINLLGGVGMIIMPIILMETGLDAGQVGLLLGGTLHSVGHVAGSGFAVSSEAGEAAITIKLARVALLSPSLILFNFLVNRKNIDHWTGHFRLPWYLWGFLIITLLTSVVDLSPEFTGVMETAGKMTLTVAMAAIGLKVSFAKLYHAGQKGLGFGILILSIQIALVVSLMLLAY